VKPIRILLADDHNVMRRGLRLLLENQPDFEVAGEAADGQEMLERAADLKPDVVLLDIAMPRLNGAEAAARLADVAPGAAVLFLSMHSDEAYVLRALKSGARGYLLKDSAEGDLINAIRTVSRGSTFFSPEISRMLAEDYIREVRARRVEDRYELLTVREKEIFGLLVSGKQNREIAGMLNLSLYTVETHRRNLQDKLRLHSLAELILFAVRKGLIAC
jgi:DNA-binding NarL/FixJ family response regulator